MLAVAILACKLLNVYIDLTLNLTLVATKELSKAMKCAMSSGYISQVRVLVLIHHVRT